MAIKDLIISIAITIFLLTVIGAIYTIGLVFKLLPVIIILFIILYVIGAFGKLTSKKIENYNVVINDDTNYNQTTCYMNGNRPFILNQDDGDSFQGSTINCVMKGKPTTWNKPNWLLPIDDPNNPAFYNQFPSQALKFN